jgi:hypothetical protein
VALRGNHNQGALVKSTIAIYITLFAVAVVAAAQILYWRLVITRTPAAAADIGDAGWLPQPVRASPEIGMEADEPDLAAEPALLAA